MTNDDLVHISKRMAYALRYSPKSFRLDLAEDGSVDVNMFVDAISDRRHRYTIDDIYAVLAMPGKTLTLRRAETDGPATRAPGLNEGDGPCRGAEAGPEAAVAGDRRQTGQRRGDTVLSGK